MDAPDLENKTEQTYDRIARDWARSHAIESDWKTEAIRLRQLLPAGKVLELGSGGGRDAAELISLGYDYVGIDSSAAMIEVAKRQVPKADFRRCSVYDTAKLKILFDGFWASAVLLHTFQKTGLMKPCRP